MAADDHTIPVMEAYEAFNNKDLNRLKNVVEENAKILNFAFGVSLDLIGYFGNWAIAFPDGKIEVTRLVQAGDTVIAEFIGRGTQTGNLQTPYGELPPTNRRVEVHFCELWEVKHGKLRSGRTYFDFAEMLRQLGVLAQPMLRQPARAETRPEARH